MCMNGQEVKSNNRMTIKMVTLSLTEFNSIFLLLLPQNECFDDTNNSKNIY